MCNRHAHTLKQETPPKLKVKKITDSLLKHNNYWTFLLPQSLPVYAIQAKAVRLSAADFKWLKKSDRLPSVIAFAFIITPFNGLRNSAKLARSGFCNIRTDPTQHQTNSIHRKWIYEVQSNTKCLSPVLNSVFSFILNQILRNYSEN